MIDDSADESLSKDVVAPMSREKPRWSAPPRVPTHLVPKPDVYDTLETGSAVTVLRAPQGYGKSAHVSEWLRRTGHPAVWMTARPTDVADEFWASLLELLVHAGVADASAGANEAAEPAAAVRDALTRWPTPFVLVVDQLEAVRAARVDTALAQMVRASPAVRLVLCSHISSDPEHLARLGMDTVFVEGQALALTHPEVARLAISLDAVVADGVVRDLCHDLWGWPAPIRGLLASSVGSGEVPRADWSTLGSLFGNRSIEGSTGSLFVVRTTVVEELTVELARSLSGTETAGHLLATLEAAGLARSRPSPQGRVYTYMPLLRSLSTTSEWTQVSELVTDAHRTAAQVLADTPERALHHAVSARDWERVVEIADASWVHLVMTDPAALADALSRLPGRWFQRMPRLVTVRDVLLEDRNDTIVALSVPWPDPDEVVEESALRDVVGVAVGQIVAARRARRPDLAGDLATRMVAALRDSDGHYRAGTEDLLPFLLLHAGVAQLVAGDLQAATDDLLACLWAGTGSDLEFVARNAAETVALLDAVRGSNQRAREHLATAATLTAPPRKIATTMDLVAPVAEALLAIDRLDLHAAEQHLEDLPAPGIVEYQRHAAWYVLDLARAMVRSLQGDLDGAMGTLEDAVVSAGSRLTVPSLAHTVLTSAHARLLAVAGNPTRAQNLLAAHPSLHDDAVLRARLSLSAGDPVAAVEICTTALWRDSSGPRERVSVLLVDMEARDALGDAPGAASALRRAVQTSRAGLLQPFALTDRALLERVAEQVPEAAEVLALLRAASLPEHSVQDVPVVELSEREVAVLRELETTASVEVLARHLFVSANTVKSQLRSLYRKLGATSRGAALAEGARLGYLT